MKNRKIFALPAIFALLVVSLLFLSGCATNEVGNSNMLGKPEPEAKPLVEKTLPANPPPQIKQETPPSYPADKGKGEVKSAPKGIFGSSAAATVSSPPVTKSAPTNTAAMNPNVEARISHLEKAIGGLSLKVDTVYSRKIFSFRIGTFASGNNDLSTNLKAQIDDVTNILKEKGLKITKIIGYSSPDGDKDENIELSRQRAEKVEEKLSANYVDLENADVFGMGEARYNGAYNDNRCVVIVAEEQ